MFEYLSQVQSAVRRFNDRMQTLAKNLGTSDLYYQKMQAKADALFGDNMRYKDGVVGLKNPSQIFKDDEMNDILEQIDKDFTTYGELKKEFAEYKKDYKMYEEKSAIPEIKDIKAFSQWKTDFPEKLKSMYNDGNLSEKALEILHRSKKSYADLQRATQYIDDMQKRKARKKVSDTFK